MSMKFLQSPCTFHRNRCLSWEPLARAVPDGLNFIVKTAACEERSRGREEGEISKGAGEEFSEETGPAAASNGRRIKRANAGEMGTGGPSDPPTPPPPPDPASSGYLPRPRGIRPIADPADGEEKGRCTYRVAGEQHDGRVQ